MFLPKLHKKLVEITIAGFDCSISDLTINLMIPTLLVFILYAFFLNIEYYPNDFQNFCEMLYESCYDFLLSQVGKKAEWSVHYLMALMFFIISLNLSNLIPWNFGATSQFMVNFSLALIVFIFVFLMGFKHYGFNVLKHFVLDVPLFMKPFLFFLEIISFSLRPFILAARLTINVVVGHMILHLIGNIHLSFPGWRILPLVFSVAFSIFEILVSFLQAYIFIILACIYIAEMSNGH